MLTNVVAWNAYYESQSINALNECAGNTSISSKVASGSGQADVATVRDGFTP